MINEYDFLTDIDYGQIPTVGIDSGYVRYTKQDPFLNYEPVDLIDLGVDGKGKMALELSIESLKISNSVYSLIDVDFELIREKGIDFYLGHILKKVEEEHEERIKANTEKKVEPKPTGNSEMVTFNPGAVRYEDIKAYLEIQNAQRYKQ